MIANPSISCQDGISSVPLHALVDQAGEIMRTTVYRLPLREVEDGDPRRGGAGNTRICDTVSSTYSSDRDILYM